jgi:prepilin-type N-terminal cleavage/methylation domain-containing protein
MRHTPTLRQRLTCKKGFTLVEMLVAAVAGALIIVLVAQMASSGLQTVGLASGRMVSAAKMHDLRTQLAADLALVPDPALATTIGQPPFRIKSNATSWTLTLFQPDPTSSTWKQVIYRWQKTTQTLERQEQGSTSQTPAETPQSLVTGLIDWQVQCLADPTQTSGPRDWTDPSRLPAALLCNAALSSIREEGPRNEPQPAAEKGRDYQWLLTIAGGGGSPP